MTDWRMMIPAPLAALETSELRSARFRVIAACALFAAIVLFFREFRGFAGSFALPVLASVATYAAVQGWLWLSAKNAADDAWLFRGRDDAA